jgi:hypothetical protein
LGFSTELIGDFFNVPLVNLIARAIEAFAALTLKALWILEKITARVIKTPHCRSCNWEVLEGRKRGRP